MITPIRSNGPFSHLKKIDIHRAITGNNVLSECDCIRQCNDCFFVRQCDMYREYEDKSYDANFIDYDGKNFNELEVEKNEYYSGIILITQEHKVLVIKNYQTNETIDLPNGKIRQYDQSISYSAMRNFYEITGIRITLRTDNSYKMKLSDKRYYFVINVLMEPDKMMRFGSFHNFIRRKSYSRSLEFVPINHIPSLNNISKDLLEFYKSHNAMISKL